ncbi:MAG: electron transport complex subunit RsxC [Clostridia bacterium]|nr:electron transport complex subunit RsxC [Clostridia bacterium]
MRQMQGGKKLTKGVPIREFVSDTVCIQMGMHLGAPSNPIVKKGDYVKMGQVIGEAVGPRGIPVHASVSGEVVDVGLKTLYRGEPEMCVTIKNDFQDTWVEDLPALGDVETVEPEKILWAIQNAGICGMGGAGFPTHVKLNVREDQYCDTLILNGAECDTFLTADHRLMLEYPEKVINGMRAAMRLVRCKRGIIAVEDNKLDAIAALRKAAKGREGIEVVGLKNKYPTGGETQLIKALLGREIPTGKLPVDTHAIVTNVGTAAAIADAVIEGKPLISRITTVTGYIKEPANLMLRIGTIVADAVCECGGYSDEVEKIVLGGSMTGPSIPHDDIPISKVTSGIVAYNKRAATLPEETPCIRCGRCVEACPMGLNPYLLKPLCDADNIKAAKANNVSTCIVCGSCAYVCPAKRRLTAAFKYAKDKIAMEERR